MEIPIDIIPLTADELAKHEILEAESYQRQYEYVVLQRQAEYRNIADPIFMQYQRGEATEQEWLDAVQAVKDANPYPVKDTK